MAAARTASAARPRVPAQRGFSLVELMIAIVLGLIITDALVSLFVGVRSASRTTSGVAALSDSGRFALNDMSQVLRGAGQMACNSTAPLAVAGTAVTRQISLLNPGASPLVTWVGGPSTGMSPLPGGEPLAGYEAAGTSPGQTVMVSATPVADTNASHWSSIALLGGNLDNALVNPPPPSGMSAPVGSMVEGSDVLVVNETQAQAPLIYTTAIATGAGAFVVNSETGFQQGQIGVISNCVQSEVFEVGSFSPGSGTGSIGLPGAPYPGNTSDTLSTGIDFGIGSHVSLVDTVVFYIGIGADGDSALFKYDSNGGVLGDGFSTNQELVPDIENMQILYGVETAATQTTQTVAQYVTADQVDSTSFTGDFNGVIAVKIALLAASPPSAVPQAVSKSPPDLLGTGWQLTAADSRMRKVYEQTIFLRNMSP
jgi:type IV pilus assembly protein PilW